MDKSMATEKEEISIIELMREYGRLLHAEAEKLELLGIETKPDLFVKANFVFHLADQLKGTEIEIKVDNLVSPGT
jgi:hypothetical protein